jgi:hypothetical protein
VSQIVTNGIKKNNKKILILKENNNYNKTKNTLLNFKKYQLNYKKILEKSKFNQRVRFLETQSM